MSSVVRCRANSRVLLDVEETLNNRQSVLSRMLLDVEQTLNNRSLSNIECCEMEMLSNSHITGNYLISNVVRCRANSQ